LQAVGTCGPGLAFVESNEECEAAAAALGLSDTTAGDTTTSSFPDGCYFFASSMLYFNSGGDRASTRTDSVSICEGTMPLASTKGAANPGYCADLDGRETSFEVASCPFPSTGVLKPDLMGLPCPGAACVFAACACANVFVNELLPTPSSAESPEWVEIFNAGESEGSLARWTLEDGAPHHRTACGLPSRVASDFHRL
jgi:hypothetical protein